jgi:hypothetical protein
MSTGAPLLLFGTLLTFLSDHGLTNGMKCIRLDRTCEYPAGRKPYGSRLSDQAQPASPAASVAASGEVGSLFPDALFLDSELFNSVSHSTLRNAHAHPVPAQVSQLLRPDADVICETYFNAIDTWFPFVSKKRLAQCIQASLPTETSELALLLLCMKLITDTPQLNNTSAVESVLYRVARDYLNTMEEVSPASLHVFQSLVLVALYEIGHGIFPAAYLTVGRAARLGILRGVHDRKNSTQLFLTPPTWTYWEEERRTWWAVLILERLALHAEDFFFLVPSPYTNFQTDISILTRRVFLLLRPSQLKVTCCPQ